MTPRCHCGEPASVRLTYIWDNDSEWKVRPLCDAHYAKAWNVWLGLRRNAPEATAGLRLVAGPA